jgi:hypothetical protein
MSSIFSSFFALLNNDILSLQGYSKTRVCFFGM